MKVYIFFFIESPFVGPLILSTMRMNLRMKKCWMKRDGLGSNWRYVAPLMCVCALSASKTLCLWCLSVHLEVTDFVMSRVTRVYSSSPTGGEYNSVESKERRGGKWNTREQRTHCQMVWWQVCNMSSWMLGLLHCELDMLCTFPCIWNFFLFLATACPSTWGMKCLTFTKLLSKETTTTCSSDRARGCRDRLCSKPNSHSGNKVTCHCCISDQQY